MKQPALVTIDSLEPRQLFSAAVLTPPSGGTPVPTNPSPTIQADLKKLAADRQKLHTDEKAAWATLSADRAAVRAAVRALQPTLDTLEKKLAADKAAVLPKIEADLAAVRAFRKAHNQDVLADLKALARDFTDPTKRAADEKKLAADRATLASELARPCWQR